MKKRKEPVKLTVGMIVVKYMIFIFNILIMAVGIMLIVIGSIFSSQFNEFYDFEGYTSIGSVNTILIVFGVVITVISIFGCGGAIRQNRCMILAFSTLLIITFFGELAFVCVGFSLRDTIHTLLLKEMNKSVNSTQPGVVNTWSLIHQEFNCCGFNSPDDFYDRGLSIPNSCCKHELRCPSDENPIFKHGCKDSLNKWTAYNLSIITTLSLVVLLFQIFGTTFSCLFARNLKKSYEIFND